MNVPGFVSKLLRLKPRGPDPALRRCGHGVEISGSVRFVFGERIELGDYVYLGPACYLNGRGGLRIDSYSILGPEVAILSAQHKYWDASMIPYDQDELLKPVVIEQGVWIGMRAMILPGVRLGEGCVVGAGAIVTRSFEAGSVVAGNPARIVRVRDMAKYRELANREQYYLKLKMQHNLRKIEVEDGVAGIKPPLKVPVEE